MQVSQFIIDDPRTREDLDDATCGICHNITIHPMQCQCRNPHLFCSDCIEKHLQSSKVCPSGDHHLSTADLTPCKFAERLVSRLLIRCPNATPPIIAPIRRRLRHLPGCRWTGAVRDLSNHTLSCPFRQAACPVCDIRLPILALGTHTTQCNNTRKCDLCNASVTDLDAHYKVCNNVAVYCPNHCHVKGEVSLIRRHEVEKHLEQCPRQSLKCQFWEVGCHFEGERAVVDNHVKQGLAEHLVLMGKGLTRVSEMEERVRRIEERLGTPT